MSANPPSRISVEAELAAFIGGFFYDPLGFARAAFPWGEKGTPLEHMSGPDKWQAQVLKDFGERLRAAGGKSLRTAVAAGHGVGKSALLSMLLLWWMSTRFDPKVICTAGTRVQLQTKTWPELSRWQELCICGHWFEWMATSVKLKARPNTHRADAIPWSAERPDAFAGAHATHYINGVNASGTLYLFDEGSAIHEAIFQTAEGGLTDPGGAIFVFGNPIRSSGAFYDAFHSRSQLWKTYRVDGRDSALTNKDLIAEWEAAYGPESDFFKVRVKGEFPAIGDMQLLPTDRVERAMANAHCILIPDAPRVLGVDVARFGADHTAFARREANIIHPIEQFHGLDTMAVARKAAHAIDSWDPDTVFVDGTGLGAGVVDRLRDLNYRIIDVQFGAGADDEQKYLNKRAEMYGSLREWLNGDVRLPDDPELKAQLIGLEYGYNNRGQIQLERKEDFKKRHGVSPDKADAVALTLAEPVRPRRLEASPYGFRVRRDYADWKVL